MSDVVSYVDSMNKLQSRVDLEIDEASHLLRAILEQRFTEIQVAALLMALAIKGEAVSEIVGFAREMRRFAVPLPHQKEEAIDTAGTGGDGTGTFNVSTAAAFVIAGAGIPVAKHGNRAISGRCGSADVLSELGVKIDASPAILSECLTRCGIAFLFAPVFHPAMKTLAHVRKELGVRTIFNLLGPLLNPAGVRRQIIGVYSLHLPPIFAEVLSHLDCQRALIFSSEDGLDEISVSGRTRISEVRNGKTTSYYVQPEDLGLLRREKRELLGGDSLENARLLREILEGKRNGAQQEIVLLNAAAGIYVSGLAETLESGLVLALDSLQSGRALDKLEKLIVISNSSSSAAL
jgi:anthranilate phosphoribosyltransferase